MTGRSARTPPALSLVPSVRPIPRGPELCGRSGFFTPRPNGTPATPGAREPDGGRDHGAGGRGLGAGNAAGAAQAGDSQGAAGDKPRALGGDATPE